MARIRGWVGGRGRGGVGWVVVEGGQLKAVKLSPQLGPFGLALSPRSVGHRPKHA